MAHTEPQLRIPRACVDKKTIIETLELRQLALCFHNYPGPSLLTLL